jgi:ATP-dependent RNA helicase DDX21
VLDECDEMLNMGFVEDVEKILGAGGEIQVPVSAAYLA